MKWNCVESEISADIFSNEGGHVEKYQTFWDTTAYLCWPV